MMGADDPNVTNNVSMFRHIDGVKWTDKKNTSKDVSDAIFMLERQSKDVGSTDSCGITYNV